MLKTKSLFTLLLATSALISCSSMDRKDSPLAKADSDMKAVLQAQASLHPKPIEKLSPEEARLQPSPADGAKLVMRQQGKDPNASMGIATKNISIPGPDGDITARVYRPKNTAGQRLPVIVYYHGGGFVIADINTYDSTPRAMAKLVNAVVVSVEYRHAPENRFPAAHEDAFNAYRWIADNTSRIGGDANRIAVMGESAGGNLAIDTAIKARDTGVKEPVYEVLVYPVAGTDLNTPSYEENANAKPLNRPMMAWFVNNTISSPADKKDPRLDIVDYADLRDLPPTTVITAEIDPLRSEGLHLASKLTASGVEVENRTYAGVTHEFFGMGSVVAKAKQAEMDAAEDLKAAFDQ